MTTVTIKNNYLEMLSAIGRVESIAEEADHAEWEYWQKEREELRVKLEDILSKIFR